jgi:hypothetical protein
MDLSKLWLLRHLDIFDVLEDLMVFSTLGLSLLCELTDLGVLIINVFLMLQS